MKKIALYLRSSKDRSDASIDAQRRALLEYAQSQTWTVTKEYSDTVFSGKTEDRPGFQQLHADMRKKKRDWDAILVLDTSRIARRVYIAEAFRHEADKHGVEILYKNLPDIDPITQTIIRSVLQAMDEYHSLISREKGLAGMRENVMKGFRAGGRAPRGYQLETVKTGVMRDGAEVLKSKLVPSADAALVGRYLKLRVAGRSRQALLNELGIDWAANSVIGMEWNALTYAGHTVWNQHAERGKHGYKGGSKHRPREEWVVNENTHEALISTEEAEALLRQLEESSVSKGRRSPARYLLTGLLMNKEGKKYEGTHRTQAGGRKDYYYRLPKGGKGSYYRCKDIDNVVLSEVKADMSSGEFAQTLLDEVRRISNQDETDPAGGVRDELVVINNKLERLVLMATELENPQPAYRQIDALEKKRGELKAEVERLEQEYNAQSLLKQLSLEHIKRMLSSISTDFEAMNREELKDALGLILERVVIEANSVEIELVYKFQPDVDCRDKMASPRGFEPLLPP